MTNYPQQVADQLDFLVEQVNKTDFGYPIREQAVREIFGPVLFRNWLEGKEDMPFDESSFTALIKQAVATSMIEDLKEEGYVDTIQGDSEDEFVFLTEKGKRIVDFAAFQRSTLN